jgi:hypothetical protein
MSVDSQPSVIHSHQLNYKPVHEANPKYRLLRLPLNNISGSSITLTGSQSQLLEFKLPNSVYNLAQSYLGYSITTPANEGANASCWVQADSFEIASNAYFGNASGLDVCNLSFAHKYVKIARKLKTKFNDYISNDSTSGLAPSNKQIGYTDGVFNNFYPATGQSSAGSFSGVTNYIEPRYLTCSVVTTGGAKNTAATVSRLIPLNSIVDTVFAVDKDLYIPSDMYIRFTAGPNSNFSYFTDDASSANSPVISSKPIVNAVTIGNIYLYLAVETNQLIIDSVMNKVHAGGGLKLNVPYTVGFKNGQSTGSTIFNMNLNLSSQYGKTLKQVLHTVWGDESSTTGSANLMLDSGNYNGTKIKTYNTFLNSRQLQDSVINCVGTGVFTDATYVVPNYDDWRENSRFAKDSVIINRSVYAMNWFHLDRFHEDNNSTLIPEENRLDGYDMTKGPVLWQLQASTVDLAKNHYTFATFNREVIIDSQGIRFDI